jgi:hypothetical protein
MSLPSVDLTVVPSSRLVLRMPRRSPRSETLPLRVRERLQPDSVTIHILDGAKRLGFVSVDDLPLVLRVLKQAGFVLVLGYDGETQRVVYYAQRMRLHDMMRGGAPVAEQPRRDRRLDRTSETAGQEVAGESVAPGSSPLTCSVGGSATALDYEDEGSERLSLGSVAVEDGSWWSAALTVPEGDAHSGRGRGTLFLRLARHGSPPSDYRGEVEMELSVPGAEADAVVALLAGVVDQARRDGVLPARAS